MKSNQVFFPTMLALLGYLRDSRIETSRAQSSSSSSAAVAAVAGAAAAAGGGGGAASSSTIKKPDDAIVEIKFQAITFARWLKHGDPNPMTYTSFHRPDLIEMRLVCTVYININININDTVS